MPKGVYERKPGCKRKISEKTKAIFRENLQRNKDAGAAKPDSAAATAAKRRNAGKAVAVRTARAILKKLPVGAQAGVVFQATRYRKVTVIDPAPVETTENGATVWEQKFHQSGKIVIYGSAHEFAGVCRIVWHEKPTLENIMDAPMFEEIEGGSDE